MATNSSNTVDISVHVTIDKEANKNILSFIVREEYHLKKLAVGAYSLNILDTQLLNDLAKRTCTVTACGDYVIVYNFTENSNKINVILFNIKPSVLKKGGCIFKLTYHDAPSITSDKILDETVNAATVQHANSQLFKSTFTSKRSNSISTTSSSSDDDDDAAANGNNEVANRNGDCKRSGANTNDLAEPLPIKRQKFDNESGEV
jgi:hypothetical protein